jgi:MFS family permease
MSEQATEESLAVPLALAEPTERVRRGWVTGLSLSSLAMWMAAYTPLQVLLPTQLQNITPHGKIVALAVVTGVGAVASALATPLAGALSDRTTHRFGVGRLRGRRHRWTLTLAVLAAVALAALSEQRTVLGVTLLWVAFCAFQNGEYASLSAAIPDHVPVRQRATVAGWFSMPQALGLVVGTILVVQVFTGLISGYLALAVLLAVLTLPFVLFTRDHPLEEEHRSPLSWRKLARSYWISPRAYPDFAWAWLTRFLMVLAVSMGTLYLLYFLRDAIHYSRLFPGQTAADGLLILILIYTAGVVLTAIVGGVISDRLGRRKAIVTAGGLVTALAAALLTFVETWPAAIIAAVLFGLGYGAYLAVDQALITQVLPAAADRAKDLGVINIAIVCPGAIAALIAAPMVSLGGYPTLFAGTAVVAILGAIGVWRIKSVA